MHVYVALTFILWKSKEDYYSKEEDNGGEEWTPWRVTGEDIGKLQRYLYENTIMAFINLYTN